jgi:hypothetical protein
MNDPLGGEGKTAIRYLLALAIGYSRSDGSFLSFSAIDSFLRIFLLSRNEDARGGNLRPATD